MRRWALPLLRQPLALLRPLLQHNRLMTAAELAQAHNGRLVRACSIITLRRQPETAKGTAFVSLEDETGTVQVICWKGLRERPSSVLLRARLMAAASTGQREGDRANLIAGHLRDLTSLQGRLSTQGREFR